MSVQKTIEDDTAEVIGEEIADKVKSITYNYFMGAAKSKQSIAEEISSVAYYVAMDNLDVEDE